MSDLPWLPRWSVTLSALAVHDGARVPWYMGIAWYLPYTDRVVLMPMPLNWLAAFARNLWIRSRKAHLRDELYGLYRYGHNKGFTAGRKSGYDAGLRHALIWKGESNAR